MTVWESLILGAVQGVTEFLPVSSSGHLVMGQALFEIRIPGVRFEVALHVATLASVLLVYRARIRTLLTTAVLRREREELRYLGLLLVATIPAGTVGILLGDSLEALFDRPSVVGIALIATGALLFSTRWALRRESSPKIAVGSALLIGVAQAFAIIPGISRSGATVVTALWLGVSPVEAAAFSFLMSIPAIAGAGVLQLGGLGETPGAPSGLVLALGSVAAAAAGILAIRLFLVMLKNRSFPAFAWYCWAAGLCFLAWLGLS
jgi:undecaprenyl-diphosphatase